MNKLNNAFYFSAPVEVVKVTPKNLEEAAKWCGGKVARVESRRVKGRVDSYVWVPTPKGSAISWAFPGMYITKRLVVTEKNELRATFSVFRKDYFAKNYFDDIKLAVDNTWERADREAKAPQKLVIEIDKGIDPNDVADMVQRYMGKVREEVTPEIPEETPEPASMVEQRQALHEDAVEAAEEQ